MHRQFNREPALDAIGLYKPGRFYSLSAFGIPWESGLLGPKGVGREDAFSPASGSVPGGVPTTTRLIVLLHETSHYLHDLCLGACMASDYALEQSYSALVAGLRIYSARKLQMHAPLIGSDYLDHWLTDPDLRSAAEVIKKSEAWVKDMWGSPAGLVECCARQAYFSSVMGLITELTGDAISEGLVAAKTVVALTGRIADVDDAKYLEAHKHALRLFPESLPATYNVARRIYDAVLGRLIDLQQWSLEEVWPLRYQTSPRCLSDIGFIYLTDIALHIPSPAEIEARIRKGRNSREDFLPTFRFCEALDSVRRRGGFPPENPDESPEFFYVRVFDFIASDPELRWPNFRETNESWDLHLTLFKRWRHEAADGYRRRLLLERVNKPHTVVMEDPMYVCWSQNAPIMHLTPNGFKFLQSMRGGNRRLYQMPLELSDMMVEHMFHSDLPLWKDVPERQTEDELSSLIENEQNNAKLLHQEAIYRSFYMELRTSLLYGDGFSCPFKPRSCAPNTSPCSHRGKFHAFEEGCCIKTYLAQERIDPECVIWDIGK